ncbi:MAG: hypothetical protein H7222_14920 [Methylotenera sp.]|nr:hypothetical protein [Oligoflexia bacterium]
MASPSQLESSIEADIQLATGFRVSESSEEQRTDCLIARVDRSNYRLAEALISQSGKTGDFFQSIRTKISRGHFDEAESLLKQAILHDEGADSLTTDLLRLELARVHYQNGRYFETLEVTQRALGNPELSGLPRLTLLQIQSACWFELGEWSKALKDIEAIRCLQLIYPVAQSGFYSEALRVKTVARSFGLIEAEAAMKQMTQRYFNSEQIGNADRLLTLLRLRLDLNRLAGLPISVCALACHTLADAMGDGLYTALALMDLKYSESKLLSQEADTRLSALRGQFSRVDQLDTCPDDSEMALQHHSESAKTLRRLSLKRRDDGRSLLQPISTLLFPENHLRVDLQTVSVHPLKLQKQTQDIIQALSAGDLTREALFTKVWNLAFVPERHDLILRNALVRARKQTQTTLLCENQKIGLRGTLVVSI